jgi:hypothetical protein
MGARQAYAITFLQHVKSDTSGFDIKAIAFNSTSWPYQTFRFALYYHGVRSCDGETGSPFLMSLKPKILQLPIGAARIETNEVCVAIVFLE